MLLILMVSSVPQILVDVRKVAKLASQARQSVSLSVDQTVAAVVSSAQCLVALRSVMLVLLVLVLCSASQSHFNMLRALATATLASPQTACLYRHRLLTTGMRIEQSLLWHSW